jgi:hypothetical protein
MKRFKQIFCHHDWMYLTKKWGQKRERLCFQCGLRQKEQGKLKWK